MIDKAALFTVRLPEDDVEVTGIGTVRVRGLSRRQANAVREHQGTEKFERLILHFGMANPALTEDEVAQWLDAAAYGELEPVLTRIGELSGLMDDSAKKAVTELSNDSEAHFRDVPSSPVGHDSSPTPSGNEQ